MPNSTDNQEFTSRVNFERVKLLYQAAASTGLISSFLVISFIPLFMWSYVDHTLLLVWAAFVVCVNIFRTLLWREFGRRLGCSQITHENVLKWETYFVLGISMTGILWAAVVFFPFQHQTMTCMIFVLLMHTGTNAAIGAMYMASKKTMLTYLIITLTPTFMRIAWGGTWPHVVIGLLGVVFILIMVRSIKIHSKNLIEIIELKITNDDLSKKDSLTGLWNRRQLAEFSRKLIQVDNPSTGPFCIMLVDIDFFKNFNDTYGHNAGDSLLFEMAALIKKNIRAQDLAVRYGGEEFMVVFVGLTLVDAMTIAERLRNIIKTETNVTISAGLAEYVPGEDFMDLTQKADERLYHAKNSGRNRVVADQMAG